MYLIDCPKKYISSQPVRLEFEFISGASGVAAYALVLTPKVISISSDGDGQRLRSL